MPRRNLAQRARLFALTRAAYAATEGVPPELVSGEEPDGCQAGEGHRAVAGPQAREGRARARGRLRLTGRAVLAALLFVLAVVGVLVFRAVDARGSDVATGSDAVIAVDRAGSVPASDAAPDADSGEASGEAGRGTGAQATTGPASVILVHVAGAVAEPGVVSLPRGARVQDAVRAAGNALPEADLAAINLARPVVDGEQIYLPTPGENRGAAPATSGGTGTQLVDLNTAEAEELDELPGIGPALAARIIAWRDDHGGFASVAELLEVSGIGPAVMADIADLVTV